MCIVHLRSWTIYYDSSRYEAYLEAPERMASNTEDVSRAVHIFTPISHPVLKSVEPAAVAKFIKESKRYEGEVADEQKEVPSMTVTSYRASINQDMLKEMALMGGLPRSLLGKK